MRKLMIAVLVLVLAGAGAFVVASRVESPEQVAARAEAPAPTPVLAPLDRGYLQGPVTVATTAQRERTVAVKAPPSVTGVVTFAERSAGDTVRPGSVLLRVNGRPLFALPGPFALYRDLQPGSSGDDVAAVQAGLKAAGHSTGADRSGVLGAGTERALRRMYEAAGYPAPAAGVLMGEVVMIADLPAVVQSVARVGTQLTGDTDLATLGAGNMVLSARLPTGSVGALAVGSAGTFLGDDGEAGSAAVTALTPDTATAETLVSLSATGALTAGKPYVVGVDNPAAESGESLLAPVAAVVTRGERSYLYPWDGTAFREVEVRVTGSVGGVAGVEPVDAEEALDEGAEVRIG